MARKPGKPRAGNCCSTRRAKTGPAFKQAVSALKKPGEITEPFVTDLGIHIVLYQSDLPDGVHELTEEERAALQSSALENKQRETLHPFLDEWKTQYEIETHPEML